jgi:hypothetical protein
MNSITLNIGDYRTFGARIFTGRDRGEEVRNKSKINDLVESYDEIQIIVPDDIITINPSFLEELFRDVVIKLGKTIFYEKFKFTCNGPYKIESNLDTAVERILRKNSSLG